MRLRHGSGLIPVILICDCLVFFCLLVDPVAETGFQDALGFPDFFVLFLPARQASEQYLTSAQFFAQLLRQIISRPQAMQVLLGKAALLPLNPATERTQFSVL